ncbi:hypothetical protein M885DRAFT_517068 [Pelagophyceae sp. CCMP2097]|nr:hypothetical protein M885DRAFT_517068 [Pelagophyceae sp. CCMP2097]
MRAGALALYLGACCVSAAGGDGPLGGRRRASIDADDDDDDDDDDTFERDVAGHPTGPRGAGPKGGAVAAAAKQGAEAAATAEQTWARCSSLRPPVTWRVEHDKGTCRFEWPRECAGYLKHFGARGDVADLFAATHVMLFGNSIVRMLALTLHEMMIRPFDTTNVIDAVVIGAHTLPNTDKALWPLHGAGTVIFDLRRNETAAPRKAPKAPKAPNAAKGARRRGAGEAPATAAAAAARARRRGGRRLVSSDGAVKIKRFKTSQLRDIPATQMCASSRCDDDFVECAALCCVTRTTASEIGPASAPRSPDRGALSYSFTSTPAEPHALKTLRDWASLADIRECTETLAPNFVLLQMTHGLLPGLVEVLDAINATRAARPAARATTFLVMTQTEVTVRPEDHYSVEFAASHAELVAYEADAERAAARYAGVALVPVSAGTVAGIEAGALRHEPENGWHFKDPGRYYLAHVVLNAMRLDKARRRLEREAETRRKDS